MSYNSSSILDNMGSMLLYLFGFVFLAAIAITIRCLRNKYKL